MQFAFSTTIWNTLPLVHLPPSIYTAALSITGGIVILILCVECTLSVESGSERKFTLLLLRFILSLVASILFLDLIFAPHGSRNRYLESATATNGIYGLLKTWEICWAPFLDGESLPSRLDRRKRPQTNGRSNGIEKVGSATKTRANFPYSLDFITTLRGVSWLGDRYFDFLSPVVLKNQDKISSKAEFLRSRASWFVLVWLTFDIADSIAKTQPWMNARQLVQHQGSSVVLVSPHDPRYAHQVTTRPIYEQLVYAAVTAIVTQFSLELFYTAFAVVCVGLFNIDPAAFPHFFCEPLSMKTDSVRSIWGQRWHHIFRRVTTRALDPWLHILRIPKKSTTGTACKVLAAFTLSGLIHCVVQARVQSLHLPPEIPLVIFDVDTLCFFLSQPFAIAFEHFFVMPLAHRLPPPIGFVVKRLWTWGWLFWSGRWWTDVWIKMGMFLVEERTIPFSVVRGVQRGEWIVQWG